MGDLKIAVKSGEDVVPRRVSEQATTCRRLDTDYNVSLTNNNKGRRSKRTNLDPGRCGDPDVDQVSW